MAKDDRHCYQFQQYDRGVVVMCKAWGPVNRGHAWVSFNGLDWEMIVLVVVLLILRVKGPCSDCSEPILNVFMPGLFSRDSLLKEINK